ncbi:cucurbitadienol 11-hydroxylase-like [Impatiens glandulifera]|uniref:cucurbitadienol 11-hydroxylase-like n=1 Tax=Impatiens glandulifera TaxID=253017 RepID=UPI001FB0F2A5|nr:cucurbitadienol 11-hydroxylase-like [Impatiens glandulifera]
MQGGGGGRGDSSSGGGGRAILQTRLRWSSVVFNPASRRLGLRGERNGAAERRGEEGKKIGKEEEKEWYYYLFYIGNLWVLSLVTVTIIIHWSKPAGIGRSRLPPGSMGLPFIGETIQFIIPSNSLDTPSFIKKRIQKYGNVFKTSLVGRPIVISSNSDFNHYILQQEGKLVEISYMDSFDKMIDMKEMSDNGFLLMGSMHKYTRGLVSSHFGNEKLKEILISRWELIVNQTLQTWSKRNSIEVKRSSSEMVFNFTANILFGYDPEKSVENFGEIVCDIMEGMMSIPLKIPGTTFHRCFKAYEKASKLISDTMKERKENRQKQRGDLLDQLTYDMEKHTFLNESNIPKIITGLLIASFETLSITLTLAIKFINETPLVLDQLLKENEEIVKNRKNGENGITWNEYKCMTFTMQVVNETLRMASVAPGILRKVLQDIQINGYTIPKGWSIMVVPSAVQLNPKIFVDPLVFNPWRWKDLGLEVTMKNFIPFGGGMRPCSGSEFSKMVMAIFIHVMVITKYKFTKIKGGEIVRKPLLGFGDGYYVKVTKGEH